MDKLHTHTLLETIGNTKLKMTCLWYLDLISGEKTTCICERTAFFFFFFRNATGLYKSIGNSDKFLVLEYSSNGRRWRK